jgi:plastocyanin
MVLAGATLSALTVTVLPGTASAAAQTLTVQVGGDSAVGNVGFEGMRFLAPPTMTVHKGDTITFNFAGFHTATLIPANTGAEDWRQDNASGVTGKYSLVVPDTDDGPTTFMFNNAVFFPTDPTCGTATSPCAWDGKSVLNSGVGVAIGAPSFSVTVNATPGDSFWVLCLVHTMMQTRIKVVPDSDTATTQAQIDAYKTQTLAADQEAAAAMIPMLQNPSSHKDANGNTVWDAYAGFDGDGWSLDAMFPTKLHITRGQTVRWHFTQLLGNLHTVTFPRSAAKTYSEVDFGGTNVKCEGANGGPDTAPTQATPPFCSTGLQDFEAEIRGAALLPMGTHKYDGTGYHSSGAMGPGGLGTAPYDLKFTKVSPKHSHGWTYACNIHGTMMTGHVYVKRP